VTGSPNGGGGRRGGGRRKNQRRRLDSRALPRRPYRDSALLHGVLALVIVAVTLFTGGSLVTGILVAVAYFVLATTWSWMRFSQRLRAVEATKDAETRGGPK
jgi:hypothetical protein